MPGRIPMLRPAGRAEARRAYEASDTRAEDKRFYASARWLRLRDLVRRQEPLCRACSANDLVVPTHAVDHILDRKDRPDLAFDRDNLQGLCKSCHNAKRGKPR